MKNKNVKTAEWFKELRNKICQEFEAIELELIGQLIEQAPGKFIRKLWERPGGGGGEMSIMRGRVFEKVGVNISTVFGTFSNNLRGDVAGTHESPAFWASGLSVVAHMHSPIIPAIHMNTRFIETTYHWFGGGIDLTPIYLNEEEARHFHLELKQLCDRHNLEFYERFKKECDEYFYVKHRKEQRGVGGIFFDNLNTGDWESDFAFIQDVGTTFLKIYANIVRKSLNVPWSSEQRAYQLQKRGRYVEFNLLYDRGTKFGLLTDAEPEAVLMSMPPLVTW